MLVWTKEDLREVTDKKRWSAQAKVLKAMGIPHFRRPDGSVVVFVDKHSQANSNGQTTQNQYPPPRIRLPEERPASLRAARPKVDKSRHR